MSSLASIRWAVTVAVALSLGFSCSNPDEAGPLAGASASPSRPVFSKPADIDNPYLPLTKFRECVLEGEEDGAPVRVVRTLLDRTKRIVWRDQTIRAAIIRDREHEDGELREETHDYFAQSDDGTVYYLGEDVDNYKDGKVVDHEGQWLLGRDTQKPGVLMPADLRVGLKFKPEDIPGLAVENAEVAELGSTLEVAAGKYDDVVKIRETQEDEEEFKWYAKGTGLLREEPKGGRVDLISCE
jgi:hypothetical protein